ncbi:ABC transporter substrate-binding protein [bacterium]|nr:MAG: ABC transporter substrate-binding protein [bacterium]
MGGRNDASSFEGSKIMRHASISRDTFVKGAAAGAAALSAGFPAFIPQRGDAADELRVGVLEEYTGTYATEGRNETRGAQIAVDAWNKRGGVLGRQVSLVKEDIQGDPGVTVQKARKLVNQDKAEVLFGCVSSADALSASSAAHAMNILYIDSGGHTDDVTGKSCHWNTFRTCHSTWMETHATGYSIAKLFGKKWFLITPDYAYGHSLAVGYQDVIKRVGGQIVANELTPLGTTDFSSYLTKVEGAKPDVLVAMPQGNDLVNLLKQASSFGLLKKLPVAGPQVELETMWALPDEARVGYWGVEWYYKNDLVLGKSNALAAELVQSYHKQYNEPPTARVCFGYTTVDRMLWAINQAKTTDAVKVARTLENAHFRGLWEGSPYYRGADHQLMWPMWFAQIRAKGTPQDKYDIFDVKDRQEADQIEQTVAEKAAVCHMDYPS